MLLSSGSYAERSAAGRNMSSVGFTLPVEDIQNIFISLETAVPVYSTSGTTNNELTMQDLAKINLLP